MGFDSSMNYKNICDKKWAMHLAQCCSALQDQVQRSLTAVKLFTEHSEQLNIVLFSRGLSIVQLVWLVSGICSICACQKTG